MAGIVGLITKMPREQAAEQLALMVQTLCHEPFYSAGTWIDESSGLYIGWTARLKQNGSNGEKPLRNERGDVVLVFSGEEFPEPETAQRLKEQGHRFDVADSSYLVHLYEEDPSFPVGLNGRFHGMLTDQNQKTAMLFNDRYGMHRIYYHESKDAFYFAAEAKAILAVCPELRKIDARGLGEFVACGCTLENRSLFEGIHILPGGSKWIFCNGSLVRKGRYFKPEEWENQDPLEPEDFYRKIREIFLRNLPRFFEGSDQVGMSLTGGLDTRMIMAWQRRQPASLPCYTFGGMLRDCQDVVLARQVAHLCKQPHQVVRVGEEFLSRFPHYAARAIYLTDGCVDVGRAPDLYLNEKVREIAPVRMTGNYGGEVLRRVRAFKPEEPRSGLFAPEFHCHIGRAKETYADLLRGHPVSFAVFKQGPWHHYGLLALEQTQISLRSPFLDNDFVRTVFQAPEPTLATNHISLRLIADGNRDLLRIPTDRGLAGERGPFLEAVFNGLLEFLFKAEYLYDMGMPHCVARVDHILSPLRLERLFLGRHKIFHFRIWYRDILSGYVREMLSDPHSLSRPYINRKGLEAVVRGHLKGDWNFTADLHKVLTLEIIHRLFLDNPVRCSFKRCSG
jgi:asparagine synthase (glutamine-hydrolysing)